MAISDPLRTSPPNRRRQSTTTTLPRDRHPPGLPPNVLRHPRNQQWRRLRFADPSAGALRRQGPRLGGDWRRRAGDIHGTRRGRRRGGGREADERGRNSGQRGREFEDAGGREARGRGLHLVRDTAALEGGRECAARVRGEVREGVWSWTGAERG